MDNWLVDEFKIEKCFVFFINTLNVKVVLRLDLSSFNSIKEFSDKIKKTYPKFDCLVNNAGMAVQGNQTTAENFEIHFATNHLGHFLLTELLKDVIMKNAARIVVVSSLMHQRGRIDFENLGKCTTTPRSRNAYYCDSKLANFYFARELYKKGFDAHVVCPGLCKTDFFRDYNPRWFHYILFSPIVWLMLRSSVQVIYYETYVRFHRCLYKRSFSLLGSAKYNSLCHRQ